MSAPFDRYGHDVLAAAGARKPVRAPRTIAADRGVVVEEVETGWCGAVVRVEKAGGVHVVHLEDRRGRLRGFPLGPGFLLDGAPVVLGPPTPNGALADARHALTRTASGSTAVRDAPARTASASRLFVEGRHDAELIEKVWGADLRVEGVVVEILEGVDHLEAAIRDFDPTPSRRMGVLVDHLVPGSKETRLVHQATAALMPGRVLVLGHPYVDVWASVKPDRLGLHRWPDVPRDVPWKVGVCRELGWPHASTADTASAWRRILGAVSSYDDLEPALLARVEELIDFVTVNP